MTEEPPHQPSARRTERQPPRSAGRSEVDEQPDTQPLTISDYAQIFGTPGAPNGYDPDTGRPYSDRGNLAVGVLNLLIPGAGRLYSGHYIIGLLQLILALLTCGLGHAWSLIDGIVILVNGGADASGRPLRP
ncbi:hypothetical protein [Lolliginicoccus suaedae]|uniref:hypothetical protein n=1 Tax=Lolliginicoccus suaedae TaxID=2605429 RepID=UPI001CAA19EC|nr:hypothetical protein [Lolliginicoccus suaedae]